MRLVVTIITLLFFTIGLYCQELDSNQIQKIDFLVLAIPESTVNNTDFNIIQESGLIHKKVLGIFKKRTGSVSTEVIFHDTLIYKVDNSYLYINGKETRDIFYYTNNKLIKYENSTYLKSKDSSEKVLQHNVFAYFKNNELIHKKVTSIDEYNFNQSEQIKVTGMAAIEVYRLLQGFEALKNYAPGEVEIKIRRDGK